MKGLAGWTQTIPCHSFSSKAICVPHSAGVVTSRENQRLPPPPPGKKEMEWTGSSVGKHHLEREGKQKSLFFSLLSRKVGNKDEAQKNSAKTAACLSRQLFFVTY